VDAVKILITGAAGYIGSVLVADLLKHGHEVIAVDNFMYNQASLLDCCADKKLTLIRGDARDKYLMKKYLRQAEAIFPLACLTGAPRCQQYPREAKAINADAVKMILGLRSKNQKIIFPTTNSGYGIEKKGILCTEKSSLKPVSLYARLKVQTEKAVLDSGNCITLRLATAFGVSPRMRLDLLVNDFTYRALTDRFLVLFQADFKRNYIHVRDVSRAFLHCLDNFDKMKNQPYNVGLSNANLSKLELCREIKKFIPDFYFMMSLKRKNAALWDLLGIEDIESIWKK
jgi:nucleoside-diphosphate-sugar epimerase